MKFGSMTNPMLDVVKEIKRIGKSGFDFAEICIEGPMGMPDALTKRKREIIKMLNRYNLFATAHTTWQIDISSPYEPVRNAWIETAKQSIMTASELNIEKINFHALSFGYSIYVKKGKGDIIKNYISALKELARFGKKHNVQIMFENTEHKIINDFKVYKHIICSVPNLKVHLDVGHAFLIGKMQEIEKYLLGFNRRIEHIHVHDNHGKVDEHLPIGRGKINYEKVCRLLKEIGYDKTITLEVFAKNKQIVQSMNKMKKWLGE